MTRKYGPRTVVAGLLILISSQSCHAQGNQGPGGAPGGILINPSGLVSAAPTHEIISPALLKRLRRSANSANDDGIADVQQRVISLRQLDLELQQTLQSGVSPNTQLRCLGGLTRIEMVVLAGNQDDILFVGPAETVVRLPTGRMVGAQTGRPCLLLDDLLTAFRNPEILQRAGCSIDPDPQRLQQSQQWIRANTTPATVQVQTSRLRQMIRIMGYWDVSVFGVPANSRIAVAMVEADYRMKRLAIGLDNPGVRRLKSSLALARPGDNMMRRWWFAAAENLLQSNASGDAWVISGPRLRLLAQEEITGPNGQLMDAPNVTGSGDRFARSFNDCFEELTERIPAFADLQNTVDILLLAAIVRSLQDSQTLVWQPVVLENSAVLPAATYSVPRNTVPMLTTRSGPGGSLIGCFSGGVLVDAEHIVAGASDTLDAMTSTAEKIREIAAGSDPGWFRDGVLQ